MSEIPAPRPESDEVLSQYPELARARELFIDLFRDRSPLVNLGYTNRQIEFTLPVLMLLQEEGVIGMDHLKNPYLSFDNPRDPNTQKLEVYYLPSRQGFNLFAVRDETTRGWSTLTSRERLMRSLSAQNPVIVFNDRPEEVVDISLFDETADTSSLDYLIRELCKYSTHARLGIRRETILTRVVMAIGIARTYKAAWVDEDTKLEFVAKLDAPGFDSDYIAYRRLSPISDSQGTLVPFGKKANISEQKVTKVLSVRKQQVSAGQLAWGRVGI